MLAYRLQEDLVGVGLRRLLLAFVLVGIIFFVGSVGALLGGAEEVVGESDLGVTLEKGRKGARGST